MNQLVQSALTLLTSTIVSDEVLIFLVSILPITEARLAVPMAFSLKMPALKAWLITVLGSVVLAPILLAFLLPVVRFLLNSKVFKRLAQSLLIRFEDKAKALGNRDTEMKKFVSVMLFVAIPLPLTGVWTGCAIASILKMRFKTAFCAVSIGGIIASGIMTMLCSLFSETVINYIITAIALIALATIFFLIFKAVMSKNEQFKEKI